MMMSKCHSSSSDRISISFDTATLRHSNLGGLGPDTSSPQSIRFGNVASDRSSRPLDLVVTAVSSYAASNVALNRIKGHFGVVNLKAPSVSGTSSVALRYCFVDAATSGEVVLDSFQLSFFDFDESFNGRQRECLTTSGFASYDLAENSSLTVSSATDSATFCSSEYGIGQDNPSDPRILTDVQKQRTLAVNFQSTACVNITYSIGCCSTTGRNFRVSFPLHRAH